MCGGSDRLVALHVFKDEVARSDIVEPADVRMVQPRNRAGFLLEPSESIAIARERLGQDFDRHVAAEPSIASAIHLAHTSRAYRRDDFVRAKASAKRKCHVSRPARLYEIVWIFAIHAGCH